ncbi:MAG: lytic transglycosylase domain-containing protein [Bacillota bacterium]|nr:lytic transglycosylase domain-containing protein [Bacillota bacterium]
MHLKTKRGRTLRYISILIILVVVVVFLLNNSTTILKIVYPQKYKEIVYKYAGEYNLDTSLVYGIIKAESNFKSDAVSSKNARGLMQITESTGKWAAGEMKLEDYSFDRLFDPETNIRMGCWYLRWLLKYFNNDTDLTIAAYNSGNGKVSQWLKDRTLSDTGESLQKIPFKETDNFLKKVNNYKSVYKRLYE